MATSFRRPTRLKTITPDIDYIMCIDENNGEFLFEEVSKSLKDNKEVDINNKYLTLTGIIFTREQYAKASFEIEELKKRYWKNGQFYCKNELIAVCLHSRDIRRKNPPFDNQIDIGKFMDELSLTLDNIDCKVISSNIDVEEYVKNDYHYDIYNTALQFLIERYIYATQNNKKGILVLESRNQNQDKKILKRLNDLFEQGTSIITSEEFKSKIVGIFFNKKRNEEKTHTYAGLEIADLFSYPIHKYIRNGGIKDKSFQIIEKKLDKDIIHSIKIFPKK